MAWLGVAAMARHGLAGSGKAGHGRQGGARRGVARRGGARHGKAGLTMKGEAMVYKWTLGARVKADANIVGTELERIRQENEGRLNPEDIVTNAQALLSPLHPLFIWDDTEAAHRYRLSQAGYLVRSIKVLRENDGTSQEVHAFVNVVCNEMPEEDQAQRCYVSTFDARSNPLLWEQVLARAAKDIESFERRYQEFCAVPTVAQAITQIKGELALAR